MNKEIHTDILEGLNPEQVTCLTHTNGPLLVIAGAGTGKTNVITKKIAYLIQKGLAAQDEILALTFTDRAANQMIEKVDMLVPYGYTDIWISTFHAFADKLLRENALEIGIDPDFKVLTRPEAAVLFREHLFDFPLRNLRPPQEPTKFIKDILAVFSRLRDEDISVKEYKDFVEELAKSPDLEDEANQESLKFHQELSGCLEVYEKLLEKENKLDFANQFYFALKMLREHPRICRMYQEKFKFILVDEFQDTNYAQFELLKILCGLHKNIMVVADDDQSIYRFRGAAYSNILGFAKTFPDCAKISLIQNYRSQQAILDSAYKLIQNNNPDRFEVKANINKRLTGLQRAADPLHLSFDTSCAEADEVAKMIKERVDSGKNCYDDFAILVRSNNDAEEFMASLNMQNVPWRFSGNQGLYSKPEVKLCLSFLRLMADISDSVSLYYLACCPIYSIAPLALNYLAGFAKRRKQDLFWMMKNFRQFEELNDRCSPEGEHIDKFVGDMEKFLITSVEVGTGRLLYLFLTQTGHLKQLIKQQSLENEIKIENLAKFFDIVKAFEQVAHEQRVVSFINYLDMLIQSGDDPATAEADLDASAVNILTVHKAKGLEFKVVFMVGLVQGRFPWPKRRQVFEIPLKMIKEVLPEGDFHVQEERRLFYVGMTRAKQELIFTSAFDYGGKRSRKVSDFVLEALGSDPKSAAVKKANAITRIDRFKDSPKQAQQQRQKEKETISLSYYQVDDYMTCPLKYKFVHILHVPILDHHTVIYGKALHDAVAKYLMCRLKNMPVSVEELIAIFEGSFSKEGFLNLTHFEERKASAIAALKRFYQLQQQSGPPTLVEKEFSFNLKGIRIRGRWDRIDYISEDEAVIIDYKTSNIEKQKDADRKASENLQLALYALSFKEIFKLKPVRTELHFLESSLVGSCVKDEADFEKVTSKVLQAAEGIRALNFEPNPGYMACNYCAFSRICHFSKVN